MGWSPLISHVEPLMSPPFDRFFHRESEVLHLLADGETETSNDEWPLQVAVALNKEDLFPQAEMWIDAKETFTDRDENGKMQDRIWGQLPKLDPVGEKKTPEELMRKEGKTAIKICNEHHGKSGRGIGTSISTWKDDVLLVAGDQP